MALDRVAAPRAAAAGVPAASGVRAPHGRAVPRGVRAVLLDGLGTLVAMKPPGPAFAGILAETHAVRISEADAARAFRAEIAYYRAHHPEGRDARSLEDLRARCAAVLARELPRPVTERLSRAELTAAMLDALRFAAFDDAPVALAGLRARGCALVAVSNWDVSLAHVLEEVGLLGLLDAAVCSAAVAAPKPDPAIFAAALALAGVEPYEALHVGDSFALDVRGARAAGVAAALLSRDGVASADAEAALAVGIPVISSLRELLA